MNSKAEFQSKGVLGEASGLNTAVITPICK